MLTVQDIQLSFGGVKALSGVSVHAATGKITSVTVSYTHLTLPTIYSV